MCLQKIKILAYFLFVNFFYYSQEYEVDQSFQIGTGFSNGNIHKVVEYPDGKLLVAGSFTTYDTQDFKRIIRLNNDGSVDNSFTSGLGFDNTIRDFELLDDGKIILVGDFTQYNGSPVNKIVKLLSDGSIDPSFNAAITIDNRINCLAIQADGKILIGGRFTEFDGTQINRIARLSSNGSIDATFNVSAGANAEVNDLIVLPNNKILVGGQFVTLAGNEAIRLARLNEDGTFDDSFHSSTGANSTINTLEVQADNKILVGGFFTSYAGNQIGNLVRLNEDGFLDNTFNIGSGGNNSVLDIAIQSDSKIIICGTFQNFNGIDLNYLCKLNSDGSFYSAFSNTFAMSSNNSIYSILLQNDNKIVVGGLFTQFNGLSSNRIVRLKEKENAVLDLLNDTNIVLSYNLDEKIISIQTSYINYETDILNCSGQVIYSGTNSKNIKLNKLDAGIYFVKIQHLNTIISKKIIVF